MMRHPMRLASRLAVAALAFTAGAFAQHAPHWAYRPIAQPAPPRTTWGSSPLDAFVFAAMQPHGLQPSQPAAPHEWLRRVTLDLTGLPPTTAELDAFLADQGADARERVVDRLLTSPAYAERWAQWWLDLARYADSQGYEKDALRLTMWRWRDWVIDAFARDLPFDRFTIEQLAGDLLPGATDEQRLATAFHRQTMTNTEGGTDDEEFRVAAVVDRVDTTMSVWMGSTLGCAQCHDHKYDPFTQKEFFQLYAFFDQTEDQDRDDDAPTLRVPTQAQQAAAAAIDGELAALRAQLVAEPGAFAVWVAAARQQHAAWLAAGPRAATWRVLGPVPAATFQDAHRTAFAAERDGVRLDAEQDGLRWREEPGFVDGRVHQWRGDNSAVYLYRTIHAAAPARTTLSFGRDDAIKVWWNGAEIVSKEVGGAAAPDQELVTVDLRAGDNTLLVKITNGGGPGGFYFAMHAPQRGDAVQAVLAKAAEACDDQDRALLQGIYLAEAPELAGVRDRIAALEQRRDAQRGAAVPVLRELPPERRRTTRIHRRGSFLDPGDVVTPDVPRIWPGLPAEAPRDRLGFARWLVSRDNPLTARVVANRIWSELFGAGLVPTLEDFGTQGEVPSHPELLDWLAAGFQGNEWSLRRLLRTIVLSATYAQDSVITERHREIDPTNRWLARGPVMRLSAEMLRDQALAVSGLLTTKAGGPSVFPPQPDGVWMQLYSGAQWKADEGEDRYRRALYTFWRRTSPHPAMLVFDAQSREACVLRRRPTNTPLQALVLWNDPQFTEAAFALGGLAMTASQARDERGMLRWLWRRCFARDPSPAEEARLFALFAAEAERELRAATKPDGRLEEGGMGPVLAAFGTVAGVILSLDEFVTRR